MTLAIACMSGSFKGVFVHGVLAGLEDHGLRADAYAAASSSTLTTAYAALGMVRTVGMEIWTDGSRALEADGASMSDAVLASIGALAPRLEASLFEPAAPRFLIATSLVTTAEAAAVTQGAGARRLGRKLLVEAARGDTSWRDQHLVSRLFDTRAGEADLRLDAANFRDVAYASTRMLHAWPIPATVSGRPYIDASYTCLCPAVELAAMGYPDVIAIATEPGDIRRDMFSGESIPAVSNGSRIRMIQPDADLREVGVDFATATMDGLNRAFELGRQKARAFVAAGA
jgi:hypothetical protein